MLINNYYRGSTDKVTGFAYDTEKKTYKNYVLPADVWMEAKPTMHGSFVVAKTAYKDPGDMDYFFPTKHDMVARLAKLKVLGFVEDPSIQLDFGVCVL